MKHVLWIPFLLLPFLPAAACDDELAEYGRRVAQLEADDAAAHYRLALWCAENRLPEQARRHHRAVLTIDPDHRASRRALGYELVRGRWAKGKELMVAKGFREHEGVWVTPEEYALLAADEIAAARAREARVAADEALKRAWNPDPSVRGRAMASIERLPAEHRLRPLSIAARIRHDDVRLRAVRGLGDLNSKDALPALYKRAIFDGNGEVRGEAVQSIRRTVAEGKPGPFVAALNSPFDAVRLHAVQALGALGDADAVGPLIARYQVVGGSGQSVYISQTNQISFVQDFDVEVAQTSFIADPVIGVIQDGLTLNFRALATTGTIDIYEKPAFADALRKLTGKDLGNDAKAWLEWYRNEQREAKRAAAEARRRQRDPDKPT